MNSREKMAGLRSMIEPLLEERLKGLPVAMAAAVAFPRPQIEAFVDPQLERPADELDRVLAAAIDFIGGLRSDEAGDLIVTARGAYRTAGIHVDDERGRHAFFVGDPVRAPDLGG